MALGFTDTRSIVDVKLVCTLVSIIRVGLLVRKYSNTHTTSLTPYSKIFQTEERMHWTHYFMRRWCLVHNSSLNKHVYACTKPGKRTFMYLCVSGVDIALFCDFSMWFWDRSDREVYFFFILSHIRMWFFKHYFNFNDCAPIIFFEFATLKHQVLW